MGCTSSVVYTPSCGLFASRMSPPPSLLLSVLFVARLGVSRCQVSRWGGRYRCSRIRQVRYMDEGWWWYAVGLSLISSVLVLVIVLIPRLSQSLYPLVALSSAVQYLSYSHHYPLFSHIVNSHNTYNALLHSLQYNAIQSIPLLHPDLTPPSPSPKNPKLAQSPVWSLPCYSCTIAG